MSINRRMDKEQNYTMLYYSAMRLNKLLLPPTMGQNLIMLDCTDIRFQNRQNLSLMIQVRSPLERGNACGKAQKLLGSRSSWKENYFHRKFHCEDFSCSVLRVYIFLHAGYNSVKFILEKIYADCDNGCGGNAQGLGQLDRE